MDKNKPSIGKIIQEKVNRSGMTITEFAEKINLSRPAVYQMFNKESVDSDLLFRISLLLGENLFSILSEQFEQIVNKNYTQEVVQEKHNLYTTNCNKNFNKKIDKKLEYIHQELVNIKNILLDINEMKM